MSQSSVKNRIILTFIVFIMIPSISLLIISIHSYSDYALNSIINEKFSIMDQVNKNISNQFSRYEDMTMTIYYNVQTRKYIDEEIYAQDSTYIGQFLSSIVNSEKYIVSAMLKIGDNLYSSGYDYVNLDSFFNRYEKDVINRKGRKVWIPTQNLSTTYRSNVKNFVLARAINSPYKTVGAMWLFFNEEFFDDVLKNKSLSDNSDVLVIAPNQFIISSNDKMQVGYTAQHGYMDDIVFGENGYFEYTDADNEDFIVVYATSPGTGWAIVTITPHKVVFRDVQNIKLMSAAMFVLYAVFIVLAYALLSRDIFNPLSQLSNGMKKVSAGNFKEKLIKRNDDEIGLLVSNYNYMLDKITQLMEDIRYEEKARNDEKMKVLSMQIGPHFIYNTLNSIKWMAIVNKQPNIKKMIESLIQLMVSVTYNTNEEISLNEEIELIKYYAYIQKLRYMNFDIVYDIPNSAGTCKVIKFILQPVIENCILYAFSDKRESGIIEISALASDDLYIFIKDDGRGFDTSILTDSKRRNDKPDHIGLLNVKERIQLNYGSEYGIDIASKIGTGTTVTFKLPIIREMVGEDEGHG